MLLEFYSYDSLLFSAELKAISEKCSNLTRKDLNEGLSTSMEEICNKENISPGNFIQGKCSQPEKINVQNDVGECSNNKALELKQVKEKRESSFSRGSENPAKVSLPKSKKTGKSKKLKLPAIEKKPIFRLAENELIFSVDGDNFFMKTEEEIKQKVKSMNHATRFWLALKFYRWNVKDFEPNTEIQSKYSKNKMCQLLGLGRSHVKKHATNIPRDGTVFEEMEKFQYLTPMELSPKKYKKYLEKHGDI